MGLQLDQHLNGELFIEGLADLLKGEAHVFVELD